MNHNGGQETQIRARGRTRLQTASSSVRLLVFGAGSATPRPELRVHSLPGCTSQPGRLEEPRRHARRRAPRHPRRQRCAALPLAPIQQTHVPPHCRRCAGGGPAGLIAALVLGRARRRCLVFDSGEKRNEASLVQHAILGADGFDRRAFLDRAREHVRCWMRAGRLHLLPVVQCCKPGRPRGFSSRNVAPRLTAAAAACRCRCRLPLPTLLQVLHYPTIAHHCLAVCNIDVHAEQVERVCPDGDGSGDCHKYTSEPCMCGNLGST